GGWNKVELGAWRRGDSRWREARMRGERAVRRGGGWAAGRQVKEGRLKPAPGG
ncbi:hypothetical protein KI387_028834, partial [Taxus chinensis]